MGALTAVHRPVIALFDRLVTDVCMYVWMDGWMDGLID